MKPCQIFISFLLFFTATSCSSRLNHVVFNETTDTFINPEFEASTLSDSEIDQVALLVRDGVTELNRNIGRYKFQYFPYVNDVGEKLVWVNAFCSQEDGWREYPMIIFDGGDCYFNLTVDLTNNRCDSIIVNGNS